MYPFLRLATVVVVSLTQQNGAFGSTLPVEFQSPARPHIQGGISEEQFNEAIDLVERFYAPVITQHGGQFLTFRYWDDDTVGCFREVGRQRHHRLKICAYFVFTAIKEQVTRFSANATWREGRSLFNIDFECKYWMPKVGKCQP